MMSKNTFFDLHRFINLCRKEMVEGWKVNLLRMLLMYGALTVFFIFMGFKDSNINPTFIKFVFPSNKIVRVQILSKNGKG